LTVHVTVLAYARVVKQRDEIQRLIDTLQRQTIELKRVRMESEKLIRKAYTRLMKVDGIPLRRSRRIER
jgi:hypothetical protein